MEFLPIGLDPGFDGLKVVNSYQLRRHPFMVSQVLSPKEIEDYNVTSEAEIFFRDDLKKAESDKYWRFGIRVKESNVDKTSFRSYQKWYTMSRVRLAEHKIVLLIGCALGMLDRAGNLIKDKQPIVSVGLPHSEVGKYRSFIINQLTGYHEFSLKQGSGEWIQFRFRLDKEHIDITSQAFAAILSASIDTNLTLQYDLRVKDVLLLDLGFKTCGFLPMRKGGILNDMAESHDSFGLLKAYERTEKEVQMRTGREDFSLITIDYLIKEKNGIYEYSDWNDNNKLKTINVREILEESINLVAQDLINYINSAFGSAGGYDAVLLCGGGASAMERFIKDNAPFAHKVIVSNGKTVAPKEKFDPVFAIAVGLYLRSSRKVVKLNAQAEEAEAAEEEVAPAEENDNVSW